MAFLSAGLNAPEKILEEFSVLERDTPTPGALSKEHKKLKSAVKRSFRHWLLRFPVQCVVAAEGVLWEKEIEALLARGDKEGLKKFRYVMWKGVERKWNAYTMLRLMQESNSGFIH